MDQLGVSQTGSHHNRNCHSQVLERLIKLREMSNLAWSSLWGVARLPQIAAEFAEVLTHFCTCLTGLWHFCYGSYLLPPLCLHISAILFITSCRPTRNSCCSRWYSFDSEEIPKGIPVFRDSGHLDLEMLRTLAIRHLSTVVWKASDTSTVVKIFASVREGNIYLIIGMLYFVLRITWLVVWPGSMQILNLLLGFSLINILESWLVESLVRWFLQLSQLTLSIWATGKRRQRACTGVT